MLRIEFTKYLKSWRTWILVGYICMIIYLTLLPSNEISWFFKLWKYDKIIHFSEYLGLGFLMINMLLINPLTKSHWTFAIIFLFIFPIFDELLQHYVPGRIPDVYDCIFDICGGCIGAYIRKLYNST